MTAPRADAWGRVWLDGQVLPQTLNRNGYRRVRVRGRWFMVNRLVCEAMHGPPPTRKHQAAHVNGDRTDNRASNLVWKLPAQNSQDRKRHGTQTAARRKLTPRLVRWARDAREEGMPVERIAAVLGVSHRHAQRVVNKHAWRTA